MIVGTPLAELCREFRARPFRSRGARLPRLAFLSHFALLSFRRLGAADQSEYGDESYGHR